MPRQRSIKSMFIEAIVFIGLLAVVGHLSVNFWERFIIQSELTQMKTSLHSLKETLANIGTAYDNLHKELKGLLEITEKKHLPTRYKSIEPEHKTIPHTLDRRRLHDIQVKTLLLAKGTENERIAKVNKTTENKVRMESKNLEAAKIEIPHVNPVKNATTLTRYPPKSTGVGHQEPEECPAKETCRYMNTAGDVHKCQNRDYDYYEHHPACKNWKY